jgi:hypothetical protein
MASALVQRAQLRGLMRYNTRTQRRARPKPLCVEAKPSARLSLTAQDSLRAAAVLQSVNAGIPIDNAGRLRSSYPRRRRVHSPIPVDPLGEGDRVVSALMAERGRKAIGPKVGQPGNPVGRRHRALRRDPVPRRASRTIDENPQRRFPEHTSRAQPQRNRSPSRQDPKRNRYEPDHGSVGQFFR